MDKLLTELEKIYEKLGGSESDIPQDRKNELEFIVDKIEDKVGQGGGGSDLPSVTSDDSGKILQVNSNGQWAASKYALKATKVGDVITLNASYNDILEMLNNGIRPFYIGEYQEDETTSYTIIYELRNISVDTLDPNSAVYKAKFFNAYFDASWEYTAPSPTDNLQFIDNPS